MFDVAESARARANIAKHQKCRGAASPTFAEVRAHRFFAHGMQRFRAHQRLDAFVIFSRGRAHLDPFGAAQRAHVAGGDDSVSRRCGSHNVGLKRVPRDFAD